MYLTGCQAQFIRQLALQVAGNHARVRIFGSKLGVGARGGDLDLMRLPIHDMAFKEGKLL